MSHESRRILEMTGLDNDPTVGPNSVRAWLGLKVWNESRSIEKVTARLGLRSTDLAYKVIGVNWRDYS
jgi:hypothetical protein